jgi:hypothetical protein
LGEFHKSVVRVFVIIFHGRWQKQRRLKQR